MTQSESSQTRAYIEWKSWDAGAFGSYTVKERVHFAAELTRAGVLISENTRVLELGFGNAAFAGWIREVTSHYMGTEANSELVVRAKELGIEAYLSSDNVEAIALDRKFDLIVTFDVLEHLEIEEIIAILKLCRGCLSDTGRIVFRVPSGDSPFSGPLFNGDITHKSLLGSSSIAQLAAIAGLEVLSMRDSAFPIFGMGIRVALQRIIVKCFRALIGKLINAVYNGNTKKVMSNNLVAVLALKRSTGHIYQTSLNSYFGARR